MCQERGLVVAAAERQQCSVLGRRGAAHVLQPRPSHPEAHPHPSAHSQTHPGVPLRHMLRHTGAFPRIQLPSPSPVHICAHPLPTLGPHGQPYATGSLPLGALVGV